MSASATYTTTVIGHGNHAALEIPDEVLAELGTNKRAPLKITINGYTYQSTATGVDGKCMVVFPSKDREASNTKAGDTVQVTLELDDGYRQVEIPEDLDQVLKDHNLKETFDALSYSKRKEFARQVAEAKATDTRIRRVEKVLNSLRN